MSKRVQPSASRHSKPESRGQRYNVYVVRVTTDQQIARLRHFIDRRIRSENMHIGGIDAEVRRPPITEAQRELVSIRIREAGGPKLIANGRRIDSEPAADDPARIGTVGRPDTPEPSPVPLFRLV